MLIGMSGGRYTSARLLCQGAGGNDSPGVGKPFSGGGPLSNPAGITTTRYKSQERFLPVHAWGVDL